jgi:hypothetical protein
VVFLQQLGVENVWLSSQISGGLLSLFFEGLLILKAKDALPSWI